jgi:photosystem II stability/assembly factor-like uncharacterized protein
LKFYAVNFRQGDLLVSENGAATFKVLTTGLPPGGEILRSVPGHENELWIASGNVFLHSKDGGKNFDKLSNVREVSTVGLGKAAPGKDEPAVFIIGSMNGVSGAFRSDDSGATWIYISDPQHGYGTMDHIIGDPRIYGRVYIGTNGRGVRFGDPAKN